MRISPLLLTALSLSILATACMPHSGGKQTGSSASSSQAPIADEKQTAALALDALMTSNMTKLAPLVDPRKGIRFTAITHVRPTSDDDAEPADQVIFPDRLTAQLASNATKTWGIEDGSGEPIVLTFKQYLAKYVASHDFRKATDVRWNHVMDRGSSIDNAMQVYPNSQIVEYHFSGFDPQYGGMDWESLRLVLQKSTTDQHWYLVGVIHDHWTP